MRSRHNMDNHGVIVGQLQAQISEYASALDKEKSKRKKLRECLTAVAEKVCDSEYGNGQLGGKNQMLTLSDTELRDFVIKNTLKQKVEFSKKILDMQNQYKSVLEEKDILARQLVDLRGKYNELNVEYEKLKNQKSMEAYTVPSSSAQESSNYVQPMQTEPENTLSSVPEKPYIGGNSGFDTRINPSINMRPDTRIDAGYEQKNSGWNERETMHSSQAESVGERSDVSSIVYHKGQPYDMKEMRTMIDVYQMKIIEVMGQTGLNEQPLLVDACVKTGELGSTTNIQENLKTLVQNKFLDRELISTPLRKKLYLYSLSSIGEAIYREKMGRKPVKDEMTKIKEMHATLPHGYCIKDTADTLGKLGYTDICMDSSTNSITIADGRRYVPDITAMSGKQKTYWEVELGHHHDKDMAEKLEKAAKVAKTVYIVVDKADTKKTLLKQIGYFKRELIRQRIDIDLVLYLGTLNELSKKMYFNTPENRIDLRKNKSTNK